MELSDLKEGLLVQRVTPKGTVLYQVSTVYPPSEDHGTTGYATLQWVFSWRNDEGALPPRTTVVSMKPVEIEKLRPCSKQLENRWHEALDAGKDG